MVEIETVDREAVASLIIDMFSLRSSAWSGVMSSMPGLGSPLSDSTSLTSLIISMSKSLAILFDREIDITSNLAGNFLTPLLAPLTGSAMKRSFLSLIPGVGNVANALLTYNISKQIGWALYFILEDGKDVRCLKEEEIKKYLQRGYKKSKAENRPDWMTSSENKYKELAEGLFSEGTTDHERKIIIGKITDLVKKREN